MTRVAIDFESNPKMLDIKPFNELPISGQVTATVVINGNMVAVGGLDKEVRKAGPSEDVGKEMLLFL